MAADEETRAAEFRRKMTARARWECEPRFPGSAAARAANRAAWEPVIDRVREWDPPVHCDDGKGPQVA